MNNEIKKHQIEELLLNAHLESEGGIDLIEEYFTKSSSLDSITKHAHFLLEEGDSVDVREAVLKNLSECIVVKNQIDLESIWGKSRRILSLLGIAQVKNKEIIRAERFLNKYL